MLPLEHYRRQRSQLCQRGLGPSFASFRFISSRSARSRSPRSRHLTGPRRFESDADRPGTLALEQVADQHCAIDSAASVSGRAKLLKSSRAT